MAASINVYLWSFVCDKAYLARVNLLSISVNRSQTHHHYPLNHACNWLPNQARETGILITSGTNVRYLYIHIYYPDALKQSFMGICLYHRSFRHHRDRRWHTDTFCVRRQYDCAIVIMLQVRFRAPGIYMKRGKLFPSSILLTWCLWSFINSGWYECEYEWISVLRIYVEYVYEYKVIDKILRHSRHRLHYQITRLAAVSQSTAVTSCIVTCDWFRSFVYLYCDVMIGTDVSILVDLLRLTCLV